jgi:uncharacterized protein (DUF169 family)
MSLPRTTQSSGFPGLSRAGTATYKSFIPPKSTKIAAIDDHYQNYDTQEHIDTFNKVAEYERAKSEILNFWHWQFTPESE